MLIVFSALSVTPGARAQAPEAESEAEPAPELAAEPASEEAEPAPAQEEAAPVEAPVPTPPAATPPAPAPAPIPIRATGILHAMVIGTNGVQSFSWPTAVAITAAANPALLADADSGFLSFQVQQTRVGAIVGEGSQLRGQLEIDFVHFDQSSPTVQAFPRLRIALVDWTVAEGHRIFLGQNWDIFSPLNAHTLNLVGNMFQSGNSGFMRHQLGWIGRFGDFELAAAVGFQGANTGPSFNNIEESLTPTGSARLTYSLGTNGSIGVSAIGSALRFTNMGVEQRRLAFGANAFADLTFGPLSLRLEGYVAQNLANMGSLTLGAGRFDVDVADVGGYASAKVTFGEHALVAIFGAAAVFDPSSVVAGYTPASMTAAAAANAALGPGIEYNLSGHLGYWFTPLRGLSIVLEPYIYVTRHRFAPADVGRFSPDRIGVGAQLGSMFAF